ncbi:resuscitation-promoting factor RpfA-like [Emydura macquarii macquarii]|uniref:resuscitation-promoting factor RpfA-like n=1 Tax=Emydura macquarii macquarii TaxID=1129001 RepID=UPI00352BD182
MAVVAGEGPVPGSELALKGDVLGLLLSHPGGIPLRDFGRLFRQHHSRRLDLSRHGYRSLRHLLGDMKELVVLDEEGEEPRVRCWHPACAPQLGPEPPKRPLRPRRVHKAVPPKQRQLEAPKTAPRLWNSCHHLAAPIAASPGHPPARSAPGHRARAVSLSHFPGSRLPVAVPRQPPLLTFANQPLGLVAYGGAAPNSSAPAPSRLPRPASPRLDPAARSELEQKVARVLRGYPGGISLFHFRQVYSAAYCDLFPLDSSASVKEQLAAMPGAVRVEGWGVQTLLFPVCPQEPPGAGEETGLPPSLPEAASPLASPAVVLAAPAGVCPSPAIPASPLEAQEGGTGVPEASPAPAGPDRPPVPCSPPPGHGVAAEAPAELPTASAAPCSPMTGLEHETMAPITVETVALEAVTVAQHQQLLYPSELVAELPLPPDLASSALPSCMGSPSASTPPLSLHYEVGTDAILYSLNSAPSSPSCPSPEPSFPPTLPAPTSGDQSPMALVSPAPAWSPIQGISGAADSPTVRTPFRPLPLSEASFAAPYKQREDGGAPWAAIKPKPRLPPVSPSRPPPMGSKGKPPKRKKDCVLL